MARFEKSFEQILQGNNARKTVEFPLPLGVERTEKPVLVDLVVLSAQDEAAAIAAGIAYAKSFGVDDPEQGDPHYDLGVMVHTLVRACVDHDVPGSFAFFFCPEDDPQNFGKGAELVLRHLDRERLHFLYQLQQVWQDECSPWGASDDEEQILAKMSQLRGVADPTRPFRMWRPATVGSLLLSTVNRLLVLLPDSLPGGSSSAPSSNGTTKLSAEA